MGLAENIGLVVLLAAVLLIVLIALRRALLSRAGGFDVSWRVNPAHNDRGWLLGQACYRGGQLGLYRSFSPLPMASKKFDRATLHLGKVRDPIDAERELLPANVVIVPGTYSGVTVEMALSVDALTALRSWVESRPPGSRLPDRPSSH